MSAQADVLIVTATKVESQAVMQAFQEAIGHKAVTTRIRDRWYLDLGELNGVQALLIQSEMGSGGPGGAQETVGKAVAALKPGAVIMAGIAFGVNQEKQAIGDVLVSRQLMLYELQRVGTDKTDELQIIPRGDRPHASTRLINCFTMADLSWDASIARVRFGLILSGDKLIDNVDYRQQLRQFEPEAIGGEMEGAGLYTACHEAGVDWILAKGICDWADGHKPEGEDTRQPLAARNAARFVVHVLQTAPLKAAPLRPAEPARGAEVYDAPEQAEPCRSTLPRQPYFFGRENELATIADVLAPESRSWGALIDGPGGIGKTALAVRAGHLAPAALFPVKIFLSAKVRELTPSGEQAIEDFMLPNYLALLNELAAELGQPELGKTVPNERANAVRRALAGSRALIVIDNVETFDEKERVRLYQFLGRLPEGCKAIVTSRRRTDVDARTLRLDRLHEEEALELIAELATRNPTLARTTEEERGALYELANGNPLLITWLAGQLGRPGSRCRTVEHAGEYMKSAPADNDPLEFIFGDLLDTFTASETAALAALTHFSEPAKVEWIAELAELAKPAVQTALEDLAGRALLVGDAEARAFFLPPLAAAFLRRKRPEAVAHAGDRLAGRAYALAVENGYDNYERFPTLEAEWPAVAAALPLLLAGDNGRLQSVCIALNSFLCFSGRWDERLALSRQAEEKAIAAGALFDAGWRAYRAGWIHYLRGQGAEVLICAARCEQHWRRTNAGALEKSITVKLRGLSYQIEKDYPAAIKAFHESLALRRSIALESMDVAISLYDLAEAEYSSGDYAAAERDYRESLGIATKHNHRENIAENIGGLADITLSRKDWPAAEALAREALDLAKAIGQQELTASNCVRLSKALARQGQAAEGLPYARRAVEIYTQLRHPDLDEARAVLRECEGGSESANERISE